MVNAVIAPHLVGIQGVILLPIPFLAMPLWVLFGFFASSGVLNYAPAAYQAGFGVMLTLQVLAVIWFIAAAVRIRQKAPLRTSARA